MTPIYFLHSKGLKKWKSLQVTSEDNKIIFLKELLEEYHEMKQKLLQHSAMQGPLLWKPFPSVRPTEYGDYFVYRAGKIHKETWNTSYWAYNGNTISHWLEISGPSVGKAGGLQAMCAACGQPSVAAACKL